MQNCRVLCISGSFLYSFCSRRYKIHGYTCLCSNPTTKGLKFKTLQHHAKIKSSMYRVMPLNIPSRIALLSSTPKPVSQAPSRTPSPPSSRLPFNPLSYNLSVQDILSTQRTPHSRFFPVECHQSGYAFDHVTHWQIAYCWTIDFDFCERDTTLGFSDPFIDDKGTYERDCVRTGRTYRRSEKREQRCRSGRCDG